MGRDRSLDEFLGGESDESDASTAPDAESNVGGGASSQSSGADGESGDDANAEAGDVNPDTDRDAELDEASAAAPDTGSTASEPDACGDGSQPADDEAERDPDGTESTDDQQAGGTPNDVEPAAITYRWEPGGVQCIECGATVEQLWSDDSGHVCAECKEW